MLYRRLSDAPTFFFSSRAFAVIVWKEVYTWIGVNTQSDNISHLKFILFMMTMARRNLTKVKSLIWHVTTLCIWNMNNIIFNSDVGNMEKTVLSIVDLVSLLS
jgi:hypothetical protein